MDQETPLLSAPISETTPVPRGGWRFLLSNTTFRSMRSANYRAYFFGQVVSFTGSWMQSAALMWLVFDLTSDPLWPPLMLVAQVGPTLLFGALGGVLADRWPKRELVFATQLAFLANSLLLVLLTASGWVSPGLLLVINGLSGLIQAVDLPARLAFVPDLVPRDDLINAVALNSLIFNSARAIGPALAGLGFLAAELITPERAVMTGALVCFTSNVLSYAAVLAALRRIRLAESSTAVRPPGSVWDGFRYVRARPSLGVLIGLTGLLCIFSWPMLTLFPAYTRQVLALAEKEYSFLVSALGLGALVAALANATFGSPKLRGWLLSTGALATVLGLLGLAIAETLAAALGSAAIGGFGLVLYLSTGQSTMQMSVNAEKRGRVMALWAMMLSASAPLGHLMAGFAAQQFALRDVLLAMTAGTAGCALTAGLLSLTGGWRFTEPTRPENHARSK